MKKKRLILLEINEINFEVVRQYLDQDKHCFPALRRLLNWKMVNTLAEPDYKNIEPWIQWVSIHSGLSYPEHGIFRLGDIVGSKVPQIFERLEKAGVSVGCISPMNADNRLCDPKYFVPDPWTKTKTDGSWWSRKIHGAISQAVNDNSQSRITLGSLFVLFLGFVRFSQVCNLGFYLKYLVTCLRKPWLKALFLDLFLHDLHFKLQDKTSPDFSCIFLNAGAHIQHHYFLNAMPFKSAKSRNPEWYLQSSRDPLRDAIECYDRIIAQYLTVPGLDIIVATALSQVPYDRLKYYYRIRDHSGFLKFIGADGFLVSPRMTRDFLVEFSDRVSMGNSFKLLSSLRVKSDGKPLFSEIEQRDLSLFVTLTYPNEVDMDTIVIGDGLEFKLAPHVVFVALKNGMHESKGYAFFSHGAEPFAPKDNMHVKELAHSVLRYYDVC